MEDDPGNARLIASALSRRSDVALDIATPGEAGIAMAHDRQPDLILLDVHLPDIPGDEALRRLRDNEATRLTPVIALCLIDELTVGDGAARSDQDIAGQLQTAR